MDVLAVLLNLLGVALAMTSSLWKKATMKQILLLICGANLLIATSYLFQGEGINGAVSCYLAFVMAIVNYLFQSKNKPIPKWLIGIYALSFIAVNLVSNGFNLYTLLAVTAALFFVASLLQSGGKGYRFCSIFNMAIWSTYDILVGAYAALLTHSILLIVNLAGMLLYDLKKKKE